MSGVTGIRLKRWPPIASEIAEATAEAAAPNGGYPTPLEPKGLCGSGLLTAAHSNFDGTSR